VEPSARDRDCVPRSRDAKLDESCVKDNSGNYVERAAKLRNLRLPSGKRLTRVLRRSTVWHCYLPWSHRLGSPAIAVPRRSQ
jgi:hypothetical protein